MPAKLRKPMLVAASALILVAALVIAYQVSRPAPVAMTLLGGARYTLPSPEGRAVLLSFWATSCAPCVREVPVLAALHRELPARGVDVIAVAMPYDPPASVLSFTQRHRVQYPVAFDLHGEVSGRFKVEAIPYAVLLDGDGRVRWKHLGVIDGDAVRAQVAKLPAAAAPR